MKLLLKIAGGVILAVVVLTAGCAALIGTAAKDATKKNHDYSVSVETSGSWSGSVGNSSYDGTGARTIHFRDIAITGAVIQKQSGDHSTLTVTLKKDGNVLDSQSTTAAYGIATVTGSDGL